ncbi:hypothetical protein EFBL_3288 [Effusibacillus lacus]|uniref:Uncharacterized protein n=2 Tax=Effusibacillus lacus TaxID=1348429 RepID=A0A292YNS3_9BACL|nr:hypothetical protein EFBL_3288 [Effusibacillus lacus]
MEPRPGLEQEIFARIMEEPVPDVKLKRDWRRIRLSAAVASFIGALILIGGFFLAANPQLTSMNHAANQSAGGSALSSAPGEKSAANSTEKQKPMADTISKGESANLGKSTADQTLTRGLRITLTEPSSANELEEAKQVGNRIAPEDFRQVVLELYKNGANWVSVNGVSVSAEDVVEWKDNFLAVKGVPLSRPYQVLVDGDPKQLQDAIERKGSSIQTLRQASKVAVEVRVVKESIK